MARVGGHWVSFALLWHVLFTLQGYSGYPHDSLCPKRADDGVGCFAGSCSSDGFLQVGQAQLAGTHHYLGVEVINPRVFERCAQDPGPVRAYTKPVLKNKSLMMIRRSHALPYLFLFLQLPRLAPRRSLARSL